ncbi:hypothetical protein BHM03_00016126 [Ensete ventricosum]|nr:hypothetical protein BHM03_00016126 [Ensete ventricosum]
MSSVVVSYAMVKESAQLNSVRVHKLICISWEEVEKLRRGRLGPLESAPQVLLSCGLSKDPAQKPRQSGELDMAPSILKSVPRLRRDLNRQFREYQFFPLYLRLRVVFIPVDRGSTIPQLLLPLTSLAKVAYSITWF